MFNFCLQQVWQIQVKKQTRVKVTQSLAGLAMRTNCWLPPHYLILGPLTKKLIASTTLLLLGRDLILPKVMKIYNYSVPALRFLKRWLPFIQYQKFNDAACQHHKGGGGLLMMMIRKKVIKTYYSIIIFEMPLCAAKLQDSHLPFHQNQSTHYQIDSDMQVLQFCCFLVLQIGKSPIDVIQKIGSDNLFNVEDVGSDCSIFQARGSC